MNPAQLIDRLREQGKKLIFAESLTGGLLADAFISVPGASDVVLGSEVTYSSALKVQLLGVDEETLGKHGAVSKEVASQMVKGVLGVALVGLELDPGQVIAVSTTGNAGPDGDPVGLVYIGLSDGIKTTVREFHFDGSRSEIRRAAVAEAIRMVEQTL